MIEDVLPEAYVKMKAQLNAVATSGAQLDLQKLFLDLTTNVVGVMAYDVSVYKHVLLKSADRYTRWISTPLPHSAKHLITPRIR